MIKLVYCITKKEEIPDEEFYRSWLEDHGPLVKSFADAMKAIRYVQSHTVLPEVNAGLIASRGLEKPYDGITEVWWNSAEELAAGSATPEGKAAAKDVMSFAGDLIHMMFASVDP